MSLAAALVLVLVGAAAIAAVRRPFVGLLAYLALDFLRPHDVILELRAFRPMLALAIVTAIATAWRYRGALWAHVRLLLPIAALAGAIALVSLLQSDPTTTFPTLTQVLKMLALVWLLCTLTSHRMDFELTLLVIAAGVLVLAIGAIVQGVDNGLLHEFHVEAVVSGPSGNHDGPFRDNNDLARVLAMSLPLWWVLGAPDRRGSLRLAAMAAFATTIVAIEFTFSRGGFIALVVALCVLASRQGIRALMVTALAVAALIVLAPQPYRDRIATLRRPAADSSVQGRRAIWTEALAQVSAHPVIGTGSAAFVVDGAPRSSHNIFIETVATVGLAGTVPYMIMLIAACAATHGVRTRLAREPGAEPLRRATMGLDATLFTYLTASMMLGDAFASPLFVVIGLMLALAAQSRAAGVASWRTADPAPIAQLPRHRAPLAGPLRA